MRWLLGSCIFLAACGGAGEGMSERPSPPPEQVTGVITEMRFDGERVVGFEVETVARSFEILIDPERDYGFNLKHLEVHRDQQLPVQVDLESRDGKLYAVDILDA